MASKKLTKQVGLGTQLPLAMRTGKFIAGFKKTLLSIIKKKAQCVIVAANTPEEMRKLLEYYCVLANNIPIKFYEGSNNELSVLAGLKFRSSVITIIDQGEADLVEVK
ncbi:60S ribosomal protein L30 [Glugoides intestinalis]